MRLRTQTSLLTATTVTAAMAVLGMLHLQFLEKSIRISIYQGVSVVTQTVARTVSAFASEGLADVAAELIEAIQSLCDLAAADRDGKTAAIDPAAAGLMMESDKGAGRGLGTCGVKRFAERWPSGSVAFASTADGGTELRATYPKKLAEI